MALAPPRGSIMPFAKFEEIKAQFDIHDEQLYFYAKDTDGTLTLRQVSEYELLAEEGLKAVYDEEADGLWEKCLEG
jgi:uncharacterized phage-like protein YoqJ